MSKIDDRNRIAQITQKFNLFSNVFMKVVFQDSLACQHVLRILTGNHDLTVANVQTEHEIAKLNSHDSRLDVLAEDQDGNLYNLELQRDKYINHAKRVRFYNAMVDSEMLEKGKDYDALPDLAIYYISEDDLWKEKQTCYRLEKKLSKRRERQLRVKLRMNWWNMESKLARNAGLKSALKVLYCGWLNEESS